MDLQPVDYEVRGRTFTGFLADGSRGARATGVLVAHEGNGLTEHAKDRAAMLAELGHVAFAMDIYGEPGPLELPRAQGLLRALMADPDELRGRASGALGVLQRHPHVDPARLAAIGFCFGGTTVLELAKSGAGLACVVGFHPGLTPARPAEPGAIKAKVLVCIGADDPIAPPEQRDAFAAEMTTAGADWQMLLMGRAWAAMRQLFDETLGAVA